MNKSSFALIAGSVCALASAASAQTTVVNNQQPAPQSPVVVAPAQQGPVVVDSRGIGGGYDHHLNSLFWSGAALFGVSYGAAIIAGATVNDTCTANNCDYSFGARSWLFVPLAGPFVAIGNIQGANAGPTIARLLLATDGVMQIGGAAMIVLGFALNNNGPRHAMSDQGIRIMPFATGTATGLAASGHF